MMKKLIVVVIALAIGVGVAMLVESSVRDSAFRRAETGRDLCFALQGYDPGNAPESLVTECGRYFREYSDGETMRYVKSGAAGVAAAGLILLLAWFFMFRRREPVAAAPPPPEA